MYISRITKIAPETADAAAKRLATAVRLRGAKRPKLTKTKISHMTMTTSNGLENEAFDCSYINQRIGEFDEAITIKTVFRLEPAAP